MLEKELEGFVKDREEMEKRFSRYEAEDNRLRDEIQKLETEVSIKNK